MRLRELKKKALEDDDMSIYSHKELEDELEDDELADWEEGFMTGYEEA